ncbi:MAG: polysaccharide biosynthesis protein [Phycisphaerales bacterium JB043]
MDAIPLEIADLASLIDRAPRPADPTRLDSVLSGKRVLITGAGGSIGSELARIACAHNPSSLVLMDRSENALFELDRELRTHHDSDAHRVLLQDVVDEVGTRRAFLRHRPDVIFHAAAHKHVPMMEDHPGQAVTNNLFGTRSVLESSIESGVSRFVLVSTDKAVEPSSVMGATKRLAELLVLTRQQHADIRTSVVRFGNVLGSSCSVLPIWMRQIREGGPLTLTDPRMTRYFMTIPEAAALVIQSAGLSGGRADVFVLDMGEPISIMDLATRLIERCGLEPVLLDEDASSLPNQMGIRVTGVRPGEKLHEELSYIAESLLPTEIEGIRSWRSQPDDSWNVDAMLEDLDRARGHESDHEVHKALERWVTGYRCKSVISVSDRVLSRAG